MDIHRLTSSVWLRTRWVAKGPRFLRADSEDGSDWADAQVTARGKTGHFVDFVMRRLIYAKLPLGPITVAPQ